MMWVAAWFYALLPSSAELMFFGCEDGWTQVSVCTPWARPQHLRLHHSESDFFSLPICRIVTATSTKYFMFMIPCIINLYNNYPTTCNTNQSICYSASSFYMFRVSTTPIIRSKQNCKYILRYCATTSLQRGQVAKPAWPRWREVAALKLWPVPEALVTVLCTPDDRCGWHPKHVEWTCRIINRLLCVVSRWTIINIVYKIKYFLKP